MMNQNSLLTGIVGLSLMLSACGTDDGPQALEFCEDYERCGLISPDGEIILKPEFDQIVGSHHEPYWIADDGVKQGVIDISGNWVLPPANGFITYLADERVIFENYAQKRTLLDLSGNVLIPFQTAELRAIDKNKFVVKSDGRWGVAGRDGQWLIEPKFEAVGYTSDPDVYVLKKDGKWGFAENDGTFFIEPQYEDAQAFSPYGLAPVMKDGKWGFISLSNDFVIPPRFEDAKYFSASGYSAVKTEEGWTIINRDGNPLFDDRFENIETHPYSENGVFVFGNNGAQGLIDKTGKVLLEADSHQYIFYRHSGFFVAMDHYKYSAIINAKGEYVADPALFEEVRLISDQYIAVSWDDKKYPMTAAGELIGFELSDVTEGAD